MAVPLLLRASVRPMAVPVFLAIFIPPTGLASRHSHEYLPNGYAIPHPRFDGCANPRACPHATNGLAIRHSPLYTPNGYAIPHSHACVPRGCATPPACHHAAGGLASHHSHYYLPNGYAIPHPRSRAFPYSHHDSLHGCANYRGIETLSNGLWP